MSKVKVSNGMIVSLIFIVLTIIIVFIYFKGSDKLREKLTKILPILSSIILTLNLLMIVLNNHESNKLKKKEQVIKLNAKSLEFVNTVYNLFLNKKDVLENLYNEIYFKKFKKPVVLSEVDITYEERNVLFIIMQHIENVFRVYYITGGEKELYNTTMYEGWDYFITLFFQSPKVQKFYMEFKEHYKSLGFHKWIENKYVKPNNYFNINISAVTEKEKNKYSIQP